MDTIGYLQGLITGAVALSAIWGFIKVIKEIKKDNDAEHDRRLGWDKAAKTIEQNAGAWDKGLADIDNVRSQMVKRYDDKLMDQDAKIQQLLSMLCMTLRAQDAILEALVEKGIGNGEIKAMHKELKDFILDQVQ